MRSPLPTINDARVSRIVPPTRVAVIEIWSRSNPPNAAPSIIESCIAATISPPPLSGSSVMPFESQVDHATGIAELRIPQAIIIVATPHKKCPVESRPNVTAARAIGSPLSNE